MGELEDERSVGELEEYEDLKVPFKARVQEWKSSLMELEERARRAEEDKEELKRLLSEKDHRKGAYNYRERGGRK